MKAIHNYPEILRSHRESKGVLGYVKQGVAAGVKSGAGIVTSLHDKRFNTLEADIPLWIGRQWKYFFQEQRKKVKTWVAKIERHTDDLKSANNAKQKAEGMKKDTPEAKAKKVKALTKAETAQKAAKSKLNTAYATYNEAAVEDIVKGFKLGKEEPLTKLAAIQAKIEEAQENFKNGGDYDRSAAALKTEFNQTIKAAFKKAESADWTPN